MGSEFIHGITCFLSLVAIFAISAEALHHDVTRFGAKGDGKTDNTKAFLAAWTAACADGQEARYVIPKGKFIVGPLELGGPCKSRINIEVEGTVQSSDFKWIHAGARNNSWISFLGNTGMSISGPGTFDGQGSQLNCSVVGVTRCTSPPMNLLFWDVSNVHIGGIKSINSNSIHIGIYKSNNVTIKDVNITKPGLDGIVISGSKGVNISNANITIQDHYCVTILDGNSGINVEKMTCEEGIGLRLEVQGDTGEEKPVTGVTVKNCTFAYTEAGIRIMSLAGSQANIALSNLVFEDIIMVNVEMSPILLAQEFCPHVSSELCKKLTHNPSKISISNVSFKNIKGTTEHQFPVNLSCGTAPNSCKDVKVSDVTIDVQGDDSHLARFICTNVKPIVSGKVSPPACKWEGFSWQRRPNSKTSKA